MQMDIGVWSLGKRPKLSFITSRWCTKPWHEIIQPKNDKEHEGEAEYPRSEPGGLLMKRQDI